MGKPAVAIDLTRDQRAELEGLLRRRQTAQGLVRRAEIVLLAADRLQNKEIVARLGKDANTVGKWRRRFADEARLSGVPTMTNGTARPRCSPPSTSPPARSSGGASNSTGPRNS